MDAPGFGGDLLGEAVSFSIASAAAIRTATN
jgi:hypothetical protein